MTADSTSTLTVAEAARRLHKSAEQVRRELRQGRLKGHRVGHRWYLDAGELEERAFHPLLDPELLARIDKLRDEIFQRNGLVFDVVAMVNEDREEH